MDYFHWCSCQLPSVLQAKEEEEEGEDTWEDPSTHPQADDEEQVPSFPELLLRISAAIATLGGRGVLPKLNWSAPRVRSKEVRGHETCIKGVFPALN